MTKTKGEFLRNIGVEVYRSVDNSEALGLSKNTAANGHSSTLLSAASLLHSSTPEKESVASLLHSSNSYINKQ